MRYFTLLSIIIFTSSLHAQNNPIDFEPGGLGADFSWATFEAPEGEENPTFTVEANPVTDGINGSATAAKIDISYGTDAVWGSAGCETDNPGNDMGLWSFTESNSIVRVMIYQEGFAAPVALKFANPTFGAEFETIVQNTVADEWVQIEFDMSSLIGSGLAPFSQFIFFPSYAPRETGHVVWFDNVVFSDGSPMSVSDLNREDFRVFPNPANGEWNINYQKSTITSYRLFNILGELVESKNINNHIFRIDASGLNTGMYFAYLETENGVQVVKLIRE